MTVRWSDCGHHHFDQADLFSNTRKERSDRCPNTTHGLWYLGLAHRGDRGNGPWLCKTSSSHCPEDEDLPASAAEVHPSGGFCEHMQLWGLSPVSHWATPHQPLSTLGHSLGLGVLCTAPHATSNPQPHTKRGDRDQKGLPDQDLPAVHAELDKK